MGDISPPVLSPDTPSYASGVIAPNGSIELLFDEQVYLGGGKIYLTDGFSQSYKARDGSMQTRIVGATETREISASEITFSDGGRRMIIDPASDLTLGKTYHLLFQGAAVQDGGGHVFKGFTDTGGLSLTVSDAATLSSMTLSHGALEDGGSTTLTLIFSEAVSGIALANFTLAHGTISELVSSDNGRIWTAKVVADYGGGDSGSISFHNPNVLDGSGNSSDLSASIGFSSEPQLDLSFDWDDGYDSGDLVTGDGYQQVRIDPHFELDAGDRVQVFVNGAWEDTDYHGNEEEEEGGSYFYTYVELNGTGVLSARVVNAANEVIAHTERTYVIDSHHPTYSVADATLSLNIGSDTGITGDNTTQYTQVVVDVELGSMAGLQVGDVIGLRDSWDGEGIMLMDWLGHHVVTAADLAGTGHFAISVNLDDGDRWGPLNLRVVVESAGGNAPEEGHYSDAALPLTLDNTPAWLDGVETSASLDILYLYFSEPLDPSAMLTLTRTSDNSSITITPAMYEQDPETHMLMVSLPTALADGASYTLHASGILYDTAGNVTTDDPLASFTAHYGIDITIGSISLGTDSGAADGITNIANQTLHGAFSGTLLAGQYIEVSFDEGDTWTHAAVSGQTWSLARSLEDGANTVMVRASNGSTHTEEGSASFYLDTSPPPAPGAPDLLPAYDDGASSTDNTTSLTSLTVRALATGAGGYHAGDLLEVLDGSTVVGHYTIVSGDFDGYGNIGHNIDLALDTLALGSHSLSVRASDIAGNAATGSTLAITIATPDTTPPTATLDIASFSYNDVTGVMGIDLLGDYSDALVQYTKNETDWFTATGSGAHREWTHNTGIQPGITLRVADSAGNIGRGYAGVPHGSVVHIESDWNQTMGADGYDVLFTNGGDDYIIYSDADGFDYIDAGSGTDTLALTGSFSFNAADWAGKVHNIEKIELNGAITMAVADENTMNGLGTPTLRILGTASAMVDLSSGAWTHTATVGGYEIYTSGNAILEIALVVGVDLGTA